MTVFNNYLTSEVVEDYSDGIISRREALRRLGLLGVGAAVALPLLAACDAAAPETGSGSPAASAPPTSPASPATPAGPRPRPTEAVTFAGPAAHCRPPGPPRASARDCPRHPRESRADRPHPFGRWTPRRERLLGARARPALGGGRTGVVPGEASPGGPERGAGRTLRRRHEGRARGTRERTPDAKIGAIGFCFGGGMVWTLLDSGEPGWRRQLRSTAPCRTVPTSPARPSGRARHLRRARRAGERQPGCGDAALEAAGLTHEIVTYPGADHAFFNDTGSATTPRPRRTRTGT